MKSFLSLTALLFLMTFSLSFGQKEIYTHPQFEKYAANHKTLAIVPFKVTMKLRPKEMEKMSAEQFDDMKKNEGLAVQSALETYYLKRLEQGRVSADREVQAITKTNALLLNAGVTWENADKYTVDDLAKILGVDAIVHGDMTTTKPMSDGASVALGIAVGFYGATNSGDVSINISDGKTGTLLWKYDQKLSSSLGSDTQTIINSLMKKASKKWPYKDVPE